MNLVFASLVYKHFFVFQIQLVHWNHDDCINFAHALSSDDGIAILSVLVEVPVRYTHLLCN